MKLSVTKMEMKAIALGWYTLTCTSKYSPPTIVTWTRNEVTLNTSEIEGVYSSYQRVTNRPFSTYDNVLTVRADNATGDYRCDLENRYTKTFEKATIGGM